MRIILIFLLLVMSGCQNSCSRPNPTKPNPVPIEVPIPPNVVTPLETNIDALNKRIEENNKKIEQAKKDKDLIAQLTLEKDNLQAKIQLNLSYIKQLEINNDTYKSQVKDKNEEIKNAKMDAWQTKLWWAAGILGFIALVGGGVAIAFPLLRPVASKIAAICAATSALMLIVAQCLPTVAWLLGLVPYILIGAIIIGLICLAIFVRHWWLDHHGFKQLVTALQPVKSQVKDFGKHMDNELDSFVINRVKNVKDKLGMKKKQ